MTNPTISQALEEFTSKFAAETIWVVPSEDNKKTISDIKSFLQSKLEEAVRGERKKISIELLHLVPVQNNPSHNNALLRLLNRDLEISHKETK